MIGIFGDSFAECLPGKPTAGWPIIIQNNVNEQVMIESAGGSSLFWSYQNFLRLQEQCDNIIFVVTCPARYTKPISLRGTRHLNSIGTVDEWKKTNSPLSQEEELTLSELAAFYRIMDIDWDILSCQMLIERILKIRPDTILVPITFQDVRFPPNTTSMYDFIYYQIKCLGVNIPFDKFYSQYTENVTCSCHFTNEINSLIADMMLESIDAGKWVGRIPNTLTSHMESFEYYYTKTGN